MGMREVPEEFRQHRYLTAGEASRFMDLRHARNGRSDTLSTIPQGIESTRSATQVFKRLLYLVFQNEAVFLPEVTATWIAVERRLTKIQPSVIRTAETLIDSGERELAADYLTYYGRTELLNALDLGESLAQSIEARARALYGIESQGEPRSPNQIW
jgi:hypothetical protein